MRLSSWLSSVVLFWAAPALAVSIGPTGCFSNSCKGSIYTLSFFETADANPKTQKFQIDYWLDASGYSGTGVTINAASVKVDEKNSIVSVSLIGFPDDISYRSLIAAGLNASGGQSNGTNGLQWADFFGVRSLGAGVPTRDLLFWALLFTLDNRSLFTFPGAASIKVRYLAARDKKVADLLPEPVTLTVSAPEPSTLLTMGLGLLGLLPLTRRRKRH